MININDLLAGSQGKLICESKNEFKGVGTDTRKDLTDLIFVALKGPNFDAHNFLSAAKSKGSTALLVQEGTLLPDDLKKDLTIVEVKDTLIGLQKLATYWRHKAKAKIISITGSNGKTTTKEFAAAIIGGQKKTIYNRGSFNNHLGVPLSLLEIQPEHQIAIIEMGMNHLGEIAELCHIAMPEVVMVTNVGRVHLEGLGTVENVAKAKEEIYQCTFPNLIRIFNLDNAHTLKMFDKYFVSTPRENIISFSAEDKKADVRFEVSSSNIEGVVVSGEIWGVKGSEKVKVFGAHNVYNLMGAASLALAAGLTPEQIWKNLSLCVTPWGRNQKVRLQSGAEVIFDGYNANPESMAKLIENSLRVKHHGKKIAVIGEMGEMGLMREKVHEELGQIVGSANFDLIWFLGVSWISFGEGIKTSQYPNEYYHSEKFDSEIIKKIKSTLKSNDRLWIKGSRSMKLEQVVKALDPIDFGDKE